MVPGLAPVARPTWLRPGTDLAEWCQVWPRLLETHDAWSGPDVSQMKLLSGQLAKYLSSLLEPVLTLYSSNCIRDSFTFADIIKTSNLDPFSVFLCSFDISSLFTNVPLAETIQICADALYSSEHPPAPFPRQIFVELMEMATSCVEFSFNDIMHRQIDGVAMGSPLGPALANIFVGYYESKLFQTTSKPEMY